MDARRFGMMLTEMYRAQARENLMLASIALLPNRKPNAVKEFISTLKSQARDKVAERDKQNYKAQVARFKEMFGRQ